MMPRRLVVPFGLIGELKTNFIGSENIALLRRLAISLLNQETSTKRNRRQKAKRAAMDINYLLRVLASTMPQSHKKLHFFLRLPWLCYHFRSNSKKGYV